MSSFMELLNKQNLNGFPLFHFLFYVANVLRMRNLIPAKAASNEKFSRLYYMYIMYTKVCSFLMLERWRKQQVKQLHETCYRLDTFEVFNYSSYEMILMVTTSIHSHPELLILSEATKMKIRLRNSWGF